LSADRSDHLQSWIEREAAIARIAQKQLFFIGGAPRSGTTWLQHLLDAHPEISCRGEAHFLKYLVEPMGSVMTARRQALEAKNRRVFGEVGGYPLPEAEDFEFLVGSAILLALSQQDGGRDCAVIGEKTPENVFYFPNLKRLFPGAKFIGVVRDPRDSLASAWHFFRGKAQEPDEEAAKIAFIRSAIPSLTRGTRMMLEFPGRYPNDSVIVTYEALSRAPEQVVAGLFRFLGVADAPEIVARCVERASFAAMSGGRPRGIEQHGSFFRKGVTGDWGSTLTSGMADLVMRELGWMYQEFGWPP
jgi:hypothetical protein